MKEGAGIGRGVGGVERVGGDVRGEGEVGRRAEFAAVVADVATHEDECIGICGDSREAAHVAYCVAGAIE